MQHKQSKTAVPVEDEDEYENDFEDYDDDFENFDEVKVAPPKIVSATPIPSKSIEATVHRQSNQNFPMNTPSESKRSSSGGTNGAKVSRSGIGSSLSRSIADPRSVRIQRVLASNVLDLKLEKATLLNIPPSSKYDLYLSELRSVDAPMRQIGVPTDNNTREIEVNTDEILFADKEVQFCYGDDTKFLNVLQSIKMKRKQQSKDTFDGDSKQLSDENRRIESSDSESFSSHSKLSEFLRRSSVAMEGLLSETRVKSVADNVGGNRDQNLFSDKSPWREIGKDAKIGANELLRGRSVSCVAFSEYQNDVFLTLHPYSVLDEDDLRPFKTLVGVWNSEKLGAPAYVLEASGDVCSVSFSASQAHFVAGGATDGCIYLWDLREAAVNHQDRDSIDLKIQRGVRKPSFSAHSLSIPSLEETTAGQQALMGDGDDDDWQFQSLHSAKVVSVISVASMAISSVAASSQFVSLDETGKMVFWVTQERRVSEEGSKDSLRASPWSNVSLVPTKTILSLRPGIKSNCGITNQNNNINFNKLNGVSRMNDGRFLFFAQDESCLLLPEADGKVSKVVRIGEPLPPASYVRSLSTEQIANNNISSSHSRGISSDQKRSQQLDFTASSRVTCMAIRPSLPPTQQSDANNSSNNINSDIFSSLLLIGREDGSIDLFRMDQPQPLLTWHIGDLLSSRSIGVEQLQRQRVVLLRWLPFHRFSFLALDGNGMLHHFDLQMDVYKPFRSESIALSLSSQISGALTHKSVSLSFPHSSVESMQILVADSGKKFKANVRQIYVPSLVQESSANSIREEFTFFESLARSTTAAAKEKRVIFGFVSAESK